MRITTGNPNQWISLGHRSLEELRADPAALDDPGLRAAVHAWSDPHAELTFESTGPSGEHALAVAVAIGAEVATIISSQSGAEARLAAVTPDSVPAVIARYAGLGPAPYRDEPAARVERSDFEAIARPPHEVLKTLAALPCAEVLSSDRWRLWSVRVAFRTTSGKAEGYGIDALGAAGHGWWMLEPERNCVTVTRTRSATLWTLLCDLVSTAITTHDSARASADESVH